MWIRIFPDVPVTKKPLEVRMGSGKGNVEYWVAKVQPGKMLYEMEGVTEVEAREAFRLAARQAVGEDRLRQPDDHVMKNHRIRQSPARQGREGAGR